MSKGFQHPKTTIHVGDGFKFLEDYKNAFDVIITDSSDLEGPAESLFHKSYFELLFGALKEGGVVTTQGFCFIFVCNYPPLEQVPTVTLETYSHINYKTIARDQEKMKEKDQSSIKVLCFSCYRSLIPGRIAENQWLHLKFIKI